MILTILLGVVGQSSSVVMPKELELMLAYRQGLFSTAYIEWAYDGTTLHQNVPMDRFTSQYAGGDYLLVEHPPDDPKVVNERKGKPWAFSENRILVQENGDRWSHVPGSVIGNLKDESSAEPFRVKDIRSLGLLPWVLEPHDAKELKPLGLFERRLLPEVQYFESRPLDGSLHEVVAYMENETETHWKLDVEHEFAPLACKKVTTLEDGGTFTEEVILSYDNIDGRRFPTRIEFLSNGSRYGLATVSHAEFDRPQHVQELNVGEALRMIPGTNVYRSSDAGWTGPLVFDGDRALPVLEAVTLEQAGLLDTSEFLTRVIRWEDDPKWAYPKTAEDFAGQHQVTRTPGLWEDYTRAFIRENNLDKQQVQDAWAHLRRCQTKAYAHLDEHKADFLEIRQERVVQRAMLQDRETGDVQREEAQKLLAALTERENGLYGRIDSIFQKLLKPGLVRLLNPDQLEAAKARALKANSNHSDK